MLPDFKIPESYARHLRIGTCSWKYDSWEGLAYDPGWVYRPEDYVCRNGGLKRNVATKTTERQKMVSVFSASLW